jgi:capsular polysaccharide transport system permease protein
MTSQRLTDHQTKARMPGRVVETRLIRTFQAALQLNGLLRARVGVLGYTFILFVVFPTVVCFFYLLFWASEEYVSEARFAVRAANESRPSVISDALSMLSSFTGGRSTNQDAFIVADYIRSRTIIEDLGGKQPVHDLYSRPTIDWFSRLPSNEPLEKVWDYWRTKVGAVIDTQSGVLTLRVRAFTPQEAHALAQKIVERSEGLVNEISERSRKDALDRAEAEVQLSLQRLAKIRAALLEFRNQSSTIDPASSAASLSETLTLLMREKLALENNRASLRGMMNEDAPTVRFLSTQIASIERQIESIQAKLTSPGSKTPAISGQLADYEDLQLQSMFAEKVFTISQAGFEKARAEQDKQQLYLVTVVRPSVPEEATYPRPFTGTAIVFALCLVIWSMISLVIASIGDHIG